MDIFSRGRRIKMKQKCLYIIIYNIYTYICINVYKVDNLNKKKVLFLTKQSEQLVL
jgi:hypothetical protein